MLPRDALLLVGAAALPTALVLLWAALSGDLAHVAGRPDLVERIDRLNIFHTRSHSTTSGGEATRP